MGPYWDSNADHQLVAVSLYLLSCSGSPSTLTLEAIDSSEICPPNYKASHPGRPVLLLCAVRPANLSVKCRHVIKLIDMLGALKDAETR